MDEWTFQWSTNFGAVLDVDRIAFSVFIRRYINYTRMLNSMCVYPDRWGESYRQKKTQQPKWASERAKEFVGDGNERNRTKQ